MGHRCAGHGCNVIACLFAADIGLHSHALIDRRESDSDYHGIKGRVRHGKGAVRKEKEMLSTGVTRSYSNSGHALANVGFKGYELLLNFVMHSGPQLRSKGRPWGQSTKTVQAFVTSHGRIISHGQRHCAPPFALGCTTASSKSCVNSCVRPVPRDLAQSSNRLRSTLPIPSTGAMAKCPGVPPCSVSSGIALSGALSLPVSIHCAFPRDGSPLDAERPGCCPARPIVSISARGVKLSFVKFPRL